MTKPLTICEQTKDILDSAIPHWMETLCAVNFDLTQLDVATQDLMESTHDRCFIGELHHAGVYRLDGQSCRTCNAFALIAPYMFKSADVYYKNRKCFKDIDPEWNHKGYNRTKKGLIAFLTDVADHIRDEHMNLANKKKIENDCEVKQ